jgi:hypothetical protein
MGRRDAVVHLRHARMEVVLGTIAVQRTGLGRAAGAVGVGEAELPRRYEVCLCIEVRNRALFRVFSRWAHLTRTELVLPRRTKCCSFCPLLLGLSMSFPPPTLMSNVVTSSRRNEQLGQLPGSRPVGERLRWRTPLINVCQVRSRFR